MENGSGLRTENDSGVSFRWRTTAMGCILRTKVVEFRWKTLVVGSEQQVNKYSGWLEIENGSGLRTENDIGELQMENVNGRQ